jgi:hypothetical protein
MGRILLWFGVASVPCTWQWRTPQSIRLISNPMTLKRMGRMTSLTYRFSIGGMRQDSEGDAVRLALNPATEEVIGAVPDAALGGSAR